MNARLTPDLILRAVAIADESSRAVIECNGIPIDQPTTRYGLADENACEIRTLADSSELMREAAQYLFDRGLASLVPDDGHGESIQLHLDRFVP